jgi:hypothetical protein
MFAKRPRNTVFVVLDFCGGERTDALYGRISAWNPGADIFLLDNGSPCDRPSCATHRNDVTSHDGGGLRDCVAIAEARGAEFLFFCSGDIEIRDALAIADFEAVALADPSVVVVSCALTPDSCGAAARPSMLRGLGRGLRAVPHVELLCCLLRLDFLRSYGGFPPSRGSWGFAQEIAYQAARQRKRILVDDRCSIRRWRMAADPEIVLASGEIINRQHERVAVYKERYGDWLRPTIHAAGLLEGTERRPS